MLITEIKIFLVNLKQCKFKVLLKTKILCLKQRTNSIGDLSYLN